MKRLALTSLYWGAYRVLLLLLNSPFETSNGKTMAQGVFFVELDKNL